MGLARVTRAGRAGRPRRATTRARELLALLIVVGALLLAPRPARAAQYGWALEAEATPAKLWVGADVEVPLTIRNLGTQPWAPRLGDRLSYHWRSDSGELLVRDGLRTQLPGVVASGEAVTLVARVQPPEAPGRYQLEWAIVREHVRWFPPPLDGPLFHEVEVEVGEFSWASVSVELPARLDAGVTIEVPARVRNRGQIPWDPQLGDALAYHWWSDEGQLLEFDGLRTAYAGVVAAGGEASVQLRIRPPPLDGSEPRRVCLQLEPLRERVRWYGPDLGDASSELTCAWVGPDPLQWALVDDDLPGKLAVDDPEQRVSVTLRNSGSEAWAEGDQLGYRWRAADENDLIEGARSQLPGPVEPGEFVSLDARLIPPKQPGHYELIWGIVREGQRWYTPPSGGRARRQLEVSGPRLAWGLVDAASLGHVWVNRTTHVELELQNLGTEAWSEASGDHLAYHWLDADGEVVDFDGLRTNFSRPVAPGERVRVTAKVRGPERAGRYRLQWELVREHERWYGPPVELALVSTWAPASLPIIRASWLAAALAVALGLITLVGAVARRRWPPTGGRAQWLVEQLPLVWAGVAIWSLTLAFHDFSGIEAWRWSSALAGSGAWLFVAAPALAGGRTRAWLAALVVLGLAILGLADLVYMHYFGSIVPVVALTASHHLGEVGDSAVAELEGAWGWLAVVPVTGLIAAASWPARPQQGSGSAPGPGSDARSRLAKLWMRLRPRVPAVGICLVLAAPALIRLGVALGGSLGARVFSEQAMVGRFGYLNAHLFDLARTLRERGRRGRPTTAELAAIQSWFQARARDVESALATAEARPAPTGHNLLLIQVEAAQSWVIGLEVEGQQVTPLLNRMRDEADWYPYLIDQTNQGKTSDAEYAVLNSQHPLGEGAICFLRADNQFFTLAHVLQARGYATISAHPYKRGFWNRAVLHPRYGFARSLFRRELGPGQETGWGLADGVFFERLLAELETLPQPWFGFAITLSLHHPYDEFPAQLSELELGALTGTRVGNYLQAMNYFDRSLAQLLDGLDDAGLLDHTIVALYGDHDARFELDEYPEVIELAGADGWDPALFHRLERVPLFVRVPAQQRPPYGRVEVTGGQVDVAPTLLHQLGIERPPGFVGQPLLPGMEAHGFAAYPDGSAFGPVSIDGGRMFVAAGHGIPREGGCFEFPAGDSRPLSECEALAERAREELSISRAVVDHDLHVELSR